MKHIRVAYTDYPIFDERCTLQKIHVLNYDGDKYCNVKPYLPDGTISEEIYNIKIGYIKMDAQLTRRPNVKTVTCWEGLKMPPKARFRKTTFDVDSISCGKYAQVARKINTFEKAKCVAAEHLRKNPTVEIVIYTDVHYKCARCAGWSSGGDRTYIEMYKCKPCVVWRDRWNRYFGGKRRDWGR